jgi:hypothetical protein
MDIPYASEITPAHGHLPLGRQGFGGKGGIEPLRQGQRPGGGHRASGIGHRASG